MDGEPVIPAPRDDDNDDVAWALQTAAVQWNRGAYADAVVWLRRAVEAAIEAGDAKRTKELGLLTSSVAARAADLERARAGPEAESEQYEEAEEIESDELKSDVPAPRSDGSKSPIFARAPSDTGDTDKDELPETPFESPVREESDDEDERTLEAEEPHTEQRHFDERISEQERAFRAEFGGENRLADERDEDDEAPTIPPPPIAKSERAPAPALAPVLDDAEPPPRESVDTHESEPDFARMPSSRPPAKLDGTAVDVVAPELPPESGPPTIDDESPPGEAQSEEPPAREPVVTPPEPSRSVADIGHDEGPPLVDGISLDQVPGFEDFPPQVQRTLAASASVENLAVDEEVSFFGAALVTRGSVGIMPAIAEAAACVARAGEVVFTRGSLDDGIALRVVALEDDTTVASWETEALDEAMAACPWVADELRAVADRFQALAGATLGPLGDRLDDALRAIVTDRLDVRSVGRDEVIVSAGQTVPGLYIVGAGRIELIADGEVVDELGPGDFLFAQEVMSAGTAKASARAGKGGALVLVAPRSVAHELMVSVPPLLEILAD